MAKQFTEIEMIAGLKENDSRVFNELFEEFFAPLRYFAVSMVSDAEEAKDIVITVFGTLWKMRANFESLANIKAFLYITVRNKCLDYLRYRQRQQEGKKELTAHLISSGEMEDTERMIVESDFLYTVFKEIQQLPGQCREVFTLTYFSGLTAGEIARRLNISVSTVTTQRSRAIQYLRNILKSEDHLLLLLLLTSLYETKMVCGL